MGLVGENAKTSSIELKSLNSQVFFS